MCLLKAEDLCSACLTDGIVIGAGAVVECGALCAMVSPLSTSAAIWIINIAGYQVTVQVQVVLAGMRELKHLEVELLAAAVVTDLQRLVQWTAISDQVISDVVTLVHDRCQVATPRSSMQVQCLQCRSTDQCLHMLPIRELDSFVNGNASIHVQKVQADVHWFVRALT